MNKEEFLKEYEALKKRFPRLGTGGDNNTNCPYSDEVYNSTNSFYVFNSGAIDNCFYVYDGAKETSDMDCYFNFQTEQCLESMDSAECNNIHYSVAVRSYNLDFCHTCFDCHDCFGCVNLQRKSYCIYNVQHTEEEYKGKLKELKKTPKEEILKKVGELRIKFPRLHSFYNESENSEYCDYSYYNNNCYYCFDCAHNENCYYMMCSYRNNNCFDALYTVDSEYSAEIIDSATCYGSYNIQHSARCYDSYFLHHCSDCNDCFGCVDLAHKKYCILNVQYTKEEYQKKLTELKESLGLKFEANSA